MYRRHDSIYGRGVDREDFSPSHLEREQQENDQAEAQALSLRMGHWI
jgi:hypothetical protein